MEVTGTYNASDVAKPPSWMGRSRSCRVEWCDGVRVDAQVNEDALRRVLAALVQQ